MAVLLARVDADAAERAEELRSELNVVSADVVWLGVAQCGAHVWVVPLNVREGVCVSFVRTS